ncbi:MAG: DNA polymerase III subunit [Nitrospinae bacterium]|nr:DNA polymerase III subunit [Nitrospinota bacterium]
MYFSQIIGHKKQVEALKKDILQRNLAQSYILSGSNGIGKKMTALLCARYINCLSPGEDDACGFCESCLKFTIVDENGLMKISTTHPDIELLQPAWKDENGKRKKNPLILVDDVRAFQNTIFSKSYIGKYKVGIVDYADMMNEESANSLLKTLEEPPDNVVIFMVTPLIKKLLPTIRSRCRTIKFYNLPEHEVNSFLTNRGVSKDKADIIAFVSMGSIGNSLTTDYEEVSSIMDDAINFLHLFFTPRVTERYVMMERYAKEFDIVRLEKFLWFLQLIISKFIAESWKNEIREKGFFSEDFFAVLSRKFSHEVITSLVWMIDRIRVDLKYNLNTHLLLDIMNIKFKEILDRG